MLQGFLTNLGRAGAGVGKASVKMFEIIAFARPSEVSAGSSSAAKTASAAVAKAELFLPLIL
jgi:hypothetical protein